MGHSPFHRRLRRVRSISRALRFPDIIARPGRPGGGDDIHEWKRNLLINRPISPGFRSTGRRISWTGHSGRRIWGYEGARGGPDVARSDVGTSWLRRFAALRACWLTFNERDFPNDLLAPYGINRSTPMSLWTTCWIWMRPPWCRLAQRNVLASKHPPIDVDRYRRNPAAPRPCANDQIAGDYRTIL